jgi:hypothetical protein
MQVLVFVADDGKGQRAPGRPRPLRTIPLRFFHQFLVRSAGAGCVWPWPRGKPFVGNRLIR